MDNLIDAQAGLMAGLFASEEFSPEQRLWARVLFEATDCLAGVVVGETRPENVARIRGETLEWVSKDEDLGVGSFGFVCDCIRLNPVWVREVITSNRLRWRELRRRMEEREACRRNRDGGPGRPRTRSYSSENSESIGETVGRTIEATPPEPSFSSGTEGPSSAGLIG